MLRTIKSLVTVVCFAIMITVGICVGTIIYKVMTVSAENVARSLGELAGEFSEGYESVKDNKDIK